MVYKKLLLFFKLFFTLFIFFFNVILLVIFFKIVSGIYVQLCESLIIFDNYLELFLFFCKLIDEIFFFFLILFIFYIFIDDELELGFILGIVALTFALEYYLGLPDENFSVFFLLSEHSMHVIYKDFYLPKILVNLVKEYSEPKQGLIPYYDWIDDVILIRTSNFKKERSLTDIFVDVVNFCFSLEGPHEKEIFYKAINSYLSKRQKLLSCMPQYLSFKMQSYNGGYDDNLDPSSGVLVLPVGFETNGEFRTADSDYFVTMVSDGSEMPVTRTQNAECRLIRYGTPPGFHYGTCEVGSGPNEGAIKFYYIRLVTLQEFQLHINTQIEKVITPYYIDYILIRREFIKGILVAILEHYDSLDENQKLLCRDLVDYIELHQQTLNVNNNMQYFLAKIV